MKLFQHIFTALFSACLVFLLLIPVISSISASNKVIEIIPSAQAQDDASYRFLAPIGGFGESIDVTSTSSFPNYIKTGINIGIGIAIMISIILIIAAGFQYMTSTKQGDISDAKSTMGNAIFGLVIALSAVLILQTINPNLIELNAVDTVTTSGSSLVVNLNNDEFSTEAYESTGNPYVLGTDPQVKLLNDAITRRGKSPSHAQEQCEKAVESIVMNSEEERFDQCKSQYGGFGVDQYYFNTYKCSYGCAQPDEINFISTGYVVDNETGDTLAEGIKGISQTEEDTVGLCETNAKNLAPSSCNVSDFVNTFSDSKCTVHCSEPTEAPNLYGSTGTMTNNDGDVVLSDIDGVAETSERATDDCLLSAMARAPGECRVDTASGFGPYDSSKCSISCSTGTLIE
jgi:hypothetical protein